MRIIRDDQSATYTLIPVQQEEEQVLASITATLQIGDMLSYGGRGRDNDERFCTVNLRGGGREEVEVETRGNITVQKTKYVGGVKLVLCGSTEEDKYEVNGIRDVCYFGSGGLIFIGETKVDNKKAIITTATHCKQCGRAMIDYLACEWKICDACRAKCEHEYVIDAIHGGGIDIDVGEFCEKCGFVKKAENKQERSQLERHLTVERELGITVIYKT